MRFTGRFLALAMFFAAARALAQAIITAPAPPTDVVDVPYPEGARGDATVSLSVLVGKDGSAARVELLRGVEPFASRARETVAGWRFTPATRDGAPISARVRVDVVFRSPRSPIEPPKANATTPTPEHVTTLVRRTEPAVEDVTVRGRHRAIGERSIGAAEARLIPGAFGEPFRAIEALPGVTPTLSGLPYFFIRGAPPSNEGYYVDGVRVPLLFHVALGPAVVHPALIDRVDVHPGASPAIFGGHAGAIVDGVLRDPRSALHAEANLRLVDAGALVETPFAKNGSALVAGRFGYPGPIVGLFSDTRLEYWDYQSRVAWRLGSHDVISVFAFGSHDFLGHVDSTPHGGVPPSGELVEDFVSDFHRVDLRYDRTTASGRLRAAVTLGYDVQGASPTYLTDLSLAARLELERTLSPALRVRAGADAHADAYAFDERAHDPSQAVVPSGVDPAPTNVRWGAWADLVWRPSSRVEIVPGARVDLFASWRAGRDDVTTPAFDPRLAARVKLSRAVTWVSTAGLAHQYPALRVGALPATVVTGAGFPPGQSSLQTVAQASQGVELALPADVSLGVTAFLSDWTALTDLTAGCVQIEPAIVPPAPPGGRASIPWTCADDDAPVRGRTFGLEVLVRRPITKRLSGIVSYTLSRSTRQAHFFTAQGETVLATVPSELDRTHVLSVAMAYDFGVGWRAGTHFVFYTGAPYSNLSGNVPLPPYNDQRDRPFFRFDARVEKRWRVGKTATVAFVVEVLNLFLGSEMSGFGIDCIEKVSPAGGTNTCRRATLGPITVPSVGVEGSL